MTTLLVVIALSKCGVLVRERGLSTESPKQLVQRRGFQWTTQEIKSTLCLLIEEEEQYI
jgi:hypothetical protein